MFVKLLLTITAIILGELLIASFAVFVYGLNFLGYTTDLEEAAFAGEVVFMILLPLVIPVFVFRKNIKNKAGKKGYWLVLLTLLGLGLIGFVYFEDIILFLFA